MSYSTTPIDKPTRPPVPNSAELGGETVATDYQGRPLRQGSVQRFRDDDTVLIELLRRGSEREAISKIRRLRAGATVQDLVRSVRRTQPDKRSAAVQCLVTLLQGRDSLEEIVQFGERLSQMPRGFGLLYDVDLLHVFRHRAIGSDALLHLLGLSSIPSPVGPTSARKRATTALVDGQKTTDTPPILFSARQWTEITSNDVFFSQLIKIFLSYHNVYWRYVEANALINALVSRKDDRGSYCSPFLVNAICALACLNCEYDDAFIQPGNHVTRGEHFHQEALQLWLLEEGRASLTNLQALVILSMESGFRGKDKLGMVLLSAALSMNESLEWSSETHNVFDKTRQRVRSCIAWTTSFVDLTCSLGLMKPCNPLDPILDDSSVDLPIVAEPWPGMPFDCTRMLQINALFIERCKLTRLGVELNSMLFGKLAANIPVLELQQIAIVWESNVHEWYQNLPEQLQYSPDIPAPLMELHAQYHCTMMQFYQHIPRVLKPQPDMSTSPPPTHTNNSSRRSSSTANSDMADESIAFTSAVNHAIAAASLLRDYRTRHGFKVALAFIFQAAALGSSILLQHFATNPRRDTPMASLPSTTSLPPIRSMSSIPLSSTTLPPIASLVRDTQAQAFEESYRCLLGLGTQLMIARGFVRVVWLTISSMDVPWLRSRAESLFAEMTGVVWQRGDAKMLSSRYPNYALRNGAEKEQHMEEVLMRWERMGM